MRIARSTALTVLAAAALLVVPSNAFAATGSGGSSGGGGGTAVQILTPSISFDLADEQATLPLHLGSHHGSPVWYVVTDTSSKADAAAQGLNYVPKLANALGTAAVQTATKAADGSLVFPGVVDFSPARVVSPGPAGNEFAGGTYAPGAVGDATYTPLVTTGDGVVIDATQVSDSSGLHDSVVSIDYAKRTVVLKSFFGIWNGHRTAYLHLDASSTVVAAAEGSTYAPNLDAAPGVGSNDVNTSARSAIIPIVNGAVGVTNPARQGLNSALRGEGDPLNINQEIPGQGNGRYSPVWDVHPVVWTQAAIDSGQRKLLVSGSDVAGAFSHGLITGGNGPANASLAGFPAGGFISNCPLFALVS